MQSTGVTALDAAKVTAPAGRRGTPSRFVIVSNRVADPRHVQTGGLAVAIRDTLRHARGLWFGWSGQLSPSAAETEPKLVRGDDLDSMTVDLTAEEHARYYLNFANGCLWPLLHYRLDLIRIDPRDEQVFFEVNARLAASLATILRDGDRVWVHDYHLMPLGAALRKRMPAVPLGFFLHVPFPPAEVFTAAPHHERLGRALFAYDVVGFQTQTDCTNFVRYAVEYLGARRLFDNLLSADGRIVRVGAFPIGIDAAEFAAVAQDTVERPVLRRLREMSGCTDLVVGVDRLDYTKGLPQRLQAFQRVLERSEHHLGHTSLVQIAPPTREGVDAYRHIRAEVESLAGRVNCRFGSLGWTPVHVLQQSMPRDLLAGLFRCSRVGLVTPLRDGMNLVAKEYVAAQDPDDPGVLVLSRFAGAAAQLRAALLVNPHDVDEVASAIDRALSMPLEERRERHEALWRNVATENISWWGQRFLSALDHAMVPSKAGTARAVEAA